MWHHELAKTERCCCRLIVQAVRAGGPGSDNSRLRDLLAQARTVNIPKDIIERNIRNGSAPNQADYVEVKRGSNRGAGAQQFCMLRCCPGRRAYGLWACR